MLQWLRELAFNQRVLSKRMNIQPQTIGDLQERNAMLADVFEEDADFLEEPETPAMTAPVSNNTPLKVIQRN